MWVNGKLLMKWAFIVILIGENLPMVFLENGKCKLIAKNGFTKNNQIIFFYNNFINYTQRPKGR